MATKIFGRHSSSNTAAFNKAVVEQSRIANRKDREFIERRLGIPISKLGSYDAYLDTGCKKVWATFRSCHLVANICQSAEMKIVTGKDRAEVRDRNILDILETPNPFDSWNEVIYQWVFHMKLTGNAYWLKDMPDQKGRPMALYPLIPQYVKIVPDEVNKVAGYVYEINGRKIHYDADEIIHFKRPHPKDMILGMGDIEPSVDLYQDYINRNKLEEEFLKNGAMPSGILFRKTGEEGEIEEKDFGKLKRKWQAQYGGKRNAGKTAFLQGDWQYLKLGLTAAEMQSVEREKFSIEQIFMNHGVPLSIAGFSSAANFATARLDEINFRKYEIVPLLDILVGKLNGTMGMERKEGTFVRAFSEDYRLAYDLSGLVDVEQELKAFGPLFDRGGMTLNELRKKAGMDEVDDPLFEEYYIQAGYQPLEIAGLASPTDSELANITNPTAPVPPEIDPDKPEQAEAE